MRTLRIAAAVAFLAAPAALAQFEGVVEMKITSAQTNGTMKAWVSKVGTRTEMDVQAPRAKSSGTNQNVKMVMLMKFAKPDEVVFVNDANRTYSIMDTKKAREAAKGARRENPTYTVKRLGKDSVAGFSCEKALITGSTGNKVEMCVSMDILGGNSLLRSLSQRGSDEGGGLPKALKDAGLDGYPIRMVMRSARDETAMTMELVSAKKQSVPASTFEPPAGYRKSDMLSAMSNPETERKMREALEKMTPEERKQFEEMMKRGSGGQ